jgi:transposase-like protein
LKRAEDIVDWDDLTAFFDFLAEHWIHLRTSNPVESVFAGVRLRTNVSKRMRRRDSALYLVFKVTQRLFPDPCSF